MRFQSSLSRYSIIVGAILLVFLLAACGGDGDDSKSAPAPSASPQPTSDTATSTPVPDEAAATAEVSPRDEPAAAREAFSLLPNPAPGTDSDSSNVYKWSDYGVTFTLPDGWFGVVGSADYDLALVSPEAGAGDSGAYITLSHFPTVGQDTSLDEALAPVAEEVGGEVETYAAAGREGFAITAENEGSTMQLILLPYDDKGAALYFQAFSPSGDTSVIKDILDSMVIKPPTPDYAAIDAAWQTSLAETGRLVYGEPDAPVSLVEFFSFTCPHCADFSHGIEKVIALEVETGRAQIELAMLAGDPLALAATRATLCATEQGKGYSAYKALFQGYYDVGRETAFTREGIDDLLAPLGLDMEALNTCIDGDQYTDVLDNMRTRFIDHGLTGTPTLLFGVDGNDPEPVMLPDDGGIWSGSIPIYFVRLILSRLIDEDIPLDQVLTQ
jgi:protein-disulfide isomerase